MTGATARYVGTIERYTGSYSQSFTFDSQGLGNLTNKTSTQTTTPNIAIGQNLRYSFGYCYSATKPHQPTQIGDIHYDYDDNGNMTAEYTQARDSGTVTAPTVTTDDTGMSSMPLGIGIAVTDPYSVNGYIRRFGWNEENQLVWSNDGKNVVTYRYGADGERTLKYRSSSESLYFDSMWTCQTDGGSLRESKHIFVGQTRIATRLSIRGHADNSYPLVNTYYYHGDHLGSAQTVTDYRGALYERLEYTPYCELWVEQKTDTDPVAKIPYRFTGKEYDTETGLYAFGARYLNPVTGMWISADPALLDGSFLPVAPTSDEARKKNSNLPGMGGVFNGLNFSSFMYSHHNPIRYVDPDGKSPLEQALEQSAQALQSNSKAGPIAIITTAALVAFAFVDGLTNNVVSTAVNDMSQSVGAWISSMFTSKSESKTVATAAQTQTKSKEPATVVIQLQLNGTSITLGTSGGIPNATGTGVTKSEASGQLNVLTAEVAASFPGMSKSKDFQDAVSRMDVRINAVPSVPDGKSVLKEYFKYKGKEYRIDLDSYRGNGRNLSAH